MIKYYWRDVMASTKIKYRNQTAKKYFTLLCIILAIIFLALYFHRWNTVKEQEKYYNSYLISTNTISLEMNDIDEIQSVLSETPSYYFLYISYTGDEDVYHLEEDLKPLIDEYQLQNNFYFLNVTDFKDTNKNYKDDIAQELGIDASIISDVPIILYFQDGELATSKGIFTAEQFEDLLETKDIRSQ